MIKLYDKDSNAPVGEITEENLRFLADQLEAESADDRDYYINRTTIDSFEELNADPRLIDVLREALGAREEMEIIWSRD